MSHLYEKMKLSKAIEMLSKCVNSGYPAKIVLNGEEYNLDVEEVDDETVDKAIEILKDGVILQG